MQIKAHNPLTTTPGRRYFIITGTESELASIESLMETAFRHGHDAERVEGGLQVYVHKSEVDVLSRSVLRLSQKASRSRSEAVRAPAKRRVLVGASMTEEAARAQDQAFDGFGKKFYLRDEDTSAYGLHPSDAGRVKFAYYRQ